MIYPYLGFAEKVLWVRVGDSYNGDRRQEKRFGSEEVGVRTVRMIFLPNYEPKILTF
ncbi:MAG: hypothetical protein F6K18_21020 [Okeania sp. SIO2C2]|uniref:hypothetical protein n=1 Tax=Okeania sp. SIO2C2 TaxID=2607787 RepID=UPI0013B65B51|nr:hypothetical protein [Okeania sp. SIO2C2]NEP89110.1 hypothetical protein [Okeania sp. SIO2C2]